MLLDIPLLSTRPTGKDESNNDFEVVEVEVEEDIHWISKQNIPAHFQQEKSWPQSTPRLPAVITKCETSDCWHLFSCWLNLSHRIVISLLGPLFSASTCSFPGNSPRDCEESSTTVADPTVHRIEDGWAWSPLHRLSQARGPGLSWGGLLTAAGFNLKFASMQLED